MSDAFDMHQSSRRIGRVRLKLRDLERGAAFYENILGLRRISAEAGRVVPTPFEQEVFNRMLAEMLGDDAARAKWGANGLAFADTADLYSMPQRAADVILAERA